MTFRHHACLGFLVCATFSDVRVGDLERLGGVQDRHSVECSSPWVCLTMSLMVRLELGVLGRKVPEVRSIILIVSRSQAINYDLTIASISLIAATEKLSDFSLFAYHSLQKEVTKQVVWKEWGFTLHHEWVHIHSKLFGILLYERCVFSPLLLIFLVFNHLFTSVLTIWIFIPKAIIWNYNYSFSWLDCPSFAHGSSFKLALGYIGHTRCRWNFWLFWILPTFQPLKTFL